MKLTIHFCAHNKEEERALVAMANDLSWANEVMQEHPDWHVGVVFEPYDTSPPEPTRRPDLADVLYFAVLDLRDSYAELGGLAAVSVLNEALLDMLIQGMKMGVRGYSKQMRQLLRHDDVTTTKDGGEKEEE